MSGIAPNSQKRLLHACSSAILQLTESFWLRSACVDTAWTWLDPAFRNCQCDAGVDFGQLSDFQLIPNHARMKPGCGPHGLELILLFAGVQCSVFWTAPKISAKSLNLTVFRLFWVCVGMQSACYAIYCFANYYIVLSGRAWLIYGAVIQLCRSRWPYVEGDPETRHVHFPNCGDIRIACYRTPRRAVPAEQRHRGSLSCGIPCGAAVADRRVAISAPWQLSEIELQ